MIITTILAITCLLYSAKIYIVNKKNNESVQFDRVEFTIYFILCSTLLFRIFLHSFNIMYCLF